MHKAWSTLAALVGICLMLVAVGVAYAGKPSGGSGGSGSTGGSSVALVVPNAGAGNSSPSYGQQVTFAVNTSATSFPWVDTKCSQNGSVVYEQWAGFYSGYLGSTMFTLGPTASWSGGAASCTASLVSFDKNGSPKTLASTSFNVTG